MINAFTHAQKLLLNPQVKAEYDALEPEFQIIEATIKKRLEKNWSQKDLAEKIDTKQSAISRLESGNANPILRFLLKNCYNFG